MGMSQIAPGAVPNSPFLGHHFWDKISNILLLFLKTANAIELFLSNIVVLVYKHSKNKQNKDAKVGKVPKTPHVSQIAPSYIKKFYGVRF